jgi:CHAT domain-containing protein
MQDRGKRGYDSELLAYGDPDFFLFDPSIEGSLKTLPHSRDEVSSIAYFFEEAKRHIRLGGYANEHALKIHLRSGQPRVLHLSTHAIIEEGIPEDSRIVLCPDPMLRDGGRKGRCG